MYMYGDPKKQQPWHHAPWEEHLPCLQNDRERHLVVEAIKYIHDNDPEFRKHLTISEGGFEFLRKGPSHVWRLVLVTFIGQYFAGWNQLVEVGERVTDPRLKVRDYTEA